MTIGKTLDQLKIGETVEFSRTVAESDIIRFAEASGDSNPIHMDQAYAEKTPFKGRIAHGVMALAFISNVLGNILPGRGTIYVSQEAHFLAPVRIGDTITTRVEVLEFFPEKNRVKLKTTCTNQDGKLIVDGAAWVMAPKKEFEGRT